MRHQAHVLTLLPCSTADTNGSVPAPPDRSELLERFLSSSHQLLRQRWFSQVAP